MALPCANNITHRRARTIPVALNSYRVVAALCELVSWTFQHHAVLRIPLSFLRQMPCGTGGGQQRVPPCHRRQTLQSAMANEHTLLGKRWISEPDRHTRSLSAGRTDRRSWSSEAERPFAEHIGRAAVGWSCGAHCNVFGCWQGIATSGSASFSYHWCLSQIGDDVNGVISISRQDGISINQFASDDSKYHTAQTVKPRQ